MAPGKDQDPAGFTHSLPGTLEINMANINTSVLVGNLTKDLDLSYTAGGMAVGKFTLAVNRDIKKDGQWIKEADFFECVAFGKQPENLKPYMTKGKQVAIEGYLKQDRWQDQQSGQNRSKVTIVANNIQLLGGKDNNQQQPEETGGYGYGN